MSVPGAKLFVTTNPDNPAHWLRRDFLGNNGLDLRTGTSSLAITVAEWPWIEIVPADTAVPQFSHGKLTAVTFWRVLSDDGKEVVRHLEKHIPSQNAILHGVYVGNQTDLGEVYPLTDFPPRRSSSSATSPTGTRSRSLTSPLDASSAVYLPNIRPNRLWRDLGPQAASLGRPVPIHWDVRPVHLHY
jgi:hypothetical protein